MKYKQLFLTLIKNKNCFLSSNLDFRIHFEGSCDTEDWSNEDQNSAAHHSIRLHFNINIEISYFKI